MGRILSLVYFLDDNDQWQKFSAVMLITAMPIVLIFANGANSLNHILVKMVLATVIWLPIGYYLSGKRGSVMADINKEIDSWFNGDIFNVITGLLFGWIFVIPHVVLHLMLLIATVMVWGTLFAIIAATIV